jgi:hypothetical protein
MSRTAIWLAAALLALAGCQANRSASVGPGTPAGGRGSGCPVAPRQIADRGIGGTGHPYADRGIGGTGIVGTITGFGSLCVNGIEVALDASAAVTLDGVAATPAALAVGQVAAIIATGSGTALRARSIAADHEVSGPVQAVTPAAGMILVAGQRVHLGDAMIGPRGLAVGDWVAVSGLRERGGAIYATRLDRRSPGLVVVSGRLARRRGARAGEGWRIGDLAVRFPGRAPPEGSRLVLTGRLGGATLDVASAKSSPALAAGPVGQRLVLEGFVDLVGGRLQIGEDTQVAVAPGFGSPPPRHVPTVVELVRTAPQTLTAIGWHPAPGHGNPGAPSRGPTPAAPAAAPGSSPAAPASPATPAAPAGTPASPAPSASPASPSAGASSSVAVAAAASGKAPAAPASPGSAAGGDTGAGSSATGGEGEGGGHGEAAGHGSGGHPDGH